MAIPTLVQSISGTAGSGTTLSLTLNNPTTHGNCLVVASASTDNSNQPLVSGVTIGGSADNFAAANSIRNNATSTVAAAGWYDPNCAGGSTAVVVSYTGDAGIGPEVMAWVMEWSGIKTTSPLDAAPAGAIGGASGTWSSGSTGTLAQSNELAIGIVASALSGGATTPGAPWTELAQIGTSGSCLLGVGYQVVSSTTALTYNGTQASNYYATVIFTLKAAPPIFTRNVFANQSVMRASVF